MRRAKMEGRHIGRTPLDVDRAAIANDRLEPDESCQKACGIESDRLQADQSGEGHCRRSSVELMRANCPVYPHGVRGRLKKSIFVGMLNDMPG
jgi:hypothetical protein